MKLNPLCKWFIAVLKLALFYLKEVVLSNVRVAVDVISKKPKISPKIITIDISNLTEKQTLAAANLITMTPGTLTLSVSDDENTMLIHSMYADDPIAEAADIKNNYIRRIRHVF